MSADTSDGLPCEGAAHPPKPDEAGKPQPSLRGQFFRYMPSQVLPAVTAVVFLPIITRMFSPSEFGTYSLLLNAVALTDILTAQWLALAVMRYLPQMRWSRADVGAVALATSIALGLCAGLMGVLLVALIPSWRSQIILAWAACSMLCTRGILNVLMPGAQVQDRSTLFSVVVNIQHIGGYLLALALASRLGVSSLIFGPSIVEFFLIPIVVWLVFGRLRLPPWKRTKEILSTFARYGLPLAFGGLGGWGTRMSGRYIVGAFHGLREAGLYSASYDVASRAITMGAVVLQVTARPRLINTWEKEGQESTRALFGKLARLYIIFAVPVVFGCGLLARPMFAILVDPEYLEAHTVLVWVCLGTAFTAIQFLLQFPLQLLERTKIIPVINIGGCIANVALNLLLVPRFGYIAAAVTTLVTYMGLAIVMAIAARRAFTWPFPTASTVRVTLASLGLMLTIPPAVKNLTHPAAEVGVGFVVGVLTYGVLLLAWGEFGFPKGNPSGNSDEAA